MNYGLWILLEIFLFGIIKLQMKGYCLKCKKKSEMDGASKPKKLKNGAYMVKGQCRKCGTNMSAIVAADKI